MSYNAVWLARAPYPHADAQVYCMNAINGHTLTGPR